MSEPGANHWKAFEPEIDADALSRKLVYLLSGRSPENPERRIPTRILLFAASAVIFVLPLILQLPNLFRSYLSLKAMIALFFLGILLAIAGVFFMHTPKWLHWLLPGGDQRRTASHPHRELCAYSIGISEDSICYLLNETPTTRIEWVEVKPIESDMQDDPSGYYDRSTDTHRLPLSPSLSQLFELEKAVDSVELKGRPFPPVRFGEIRTVKRAGQDLEIWTHDDRLMRIPRFFPVDEILSELKRRVPAAVERGRKLS